MCANLLILLFEYINIYAISCLLGITYLLLLCSVNVKAPKNHSGKSSGSFLRVQERVYIVLNINFIAKVTLLTNEIKLLLKRKAFFMPVQFTKSLPFYANNVHFIIYFYSGL